MRVTVDAIKITLLVRISYICPGAFFFANSLGVFTKRRPFLYIAPHVTPVPFVRTEVDRLNCEFRDNYAPRGNPGARRAA